MYLKFDKHFKLSSFVFYSGGCETVFTKSPLNERDIFWDNYRFDLLRYLRDIYCCGSGVNTLNYSNTKQNAFRQLGKCFAFVWYRVVLNFCDMSKATPLQFFKYAVKINPIETSNTIIFQIFHFIEIHVRWCVLVILQSILYESLKTTNWLEFTCMQSEAYLAT